MKTSTAARRRKSKPAGSGPAPSRPAAHTRFGSRRRLIVVAVFAVLACAAALAAPYALRGAGAMLVAESPLEKADVALVLGGDITPEGQRTLAAVKLYREGYVKKVALSGPAIGFGVHEDQLSMPVAIASGVPSRDLIPLPVQAFSTLQEAQQQVPQLEARGFHSMYVVTSNFHTARAARIFRKQAAGQLRVLVYPAADPWFSPAAWWHNREGRKTFVLEWLKTLHSLLE